MELPDKHRKLRMWNKFLILRSRARLTCILVVQQLLDLFTTWWLIFHIKVGKEVNPMLQVVNGEDGEAWLVGAKVFCAVLGGLACWWSLSQKHIKPYFWYVWNTPAYVYGVLLIWNTSLIVYASTML